MDSRCYCSRRRRDRDKGLGVEQPHRRSMLDSRDYAAWISSRLGIIRLPDGFASPFFRSLPVSIPWIIPPAQCAHPLDDGTAVLLEHSIEETVETLDSCDRRTYRSLLKPLTG